MTPADAIAEMRALIRGSRSVVAFTGAGISTESGIPDFRSPNSPWMRHKPIPFEQFMGSAAARREAWRRKFAMDDLYRGAQPSTGHHALAALVASGKMPGIITQNIDGLHQASGVPPERVVELHGNGTYAHCLSCGRRFELGHVRERFEATGEAPACSACGGVVKAATISFGQEMPAEPMRRAQELTLGCDLFLAIGSSLVVYPAAGFPIVAKRNGARLVIVNREPTELDAVADLVVLAEIGDAFSGLVSREGDTSAEPWGP